MYERFEELCNKKNVTAYKVCKETGIQTSTISSWKKGRYIPKREKMSKIASYFDVTVEYLMGEDEKPSEPTNIISDGQKNESVISDEEIDLLNLFRKLNEEGKSKLLDYADDLVCSEKYIKNHEIIVAKEA